MTHFRYSFLLTVMSKQVCLEVEELIHKVSAVNMGSLDTITPSPALLREADLLTAPIICRSCANDIIFQAMGSRFCFSTPIHDPFQPICLLVIIKTRCKISPRAACPSSSIKSPDHCQVSQQMMGTLDMWWVLFTCFAFSFRCELCSSVFVTLCDCRQLILHTSALFLYHYQCYWLLQSGFAKVFVSRKSSGVWIVFHGFSLKRATRFVFILGKYTHLSLVGGCTFSCMSLQPLMTWYHISHSSAVLSHFCLATLTFSRSLVTHSIHLCFGLARLFIPASSNAHLFCLKRNK